jgi:hypothetical protein
MLSRATIVFVLACLAAPSVAAARPPARALLADCVRSAEETQRAGAFVGEMRTVASADRMQMRFKLQARTPERWRWSAVSAPGFGTWLTSVPGTARYVYTKRVESLLAPASYRVQVRFRWLDSAGRIVRTAWDHSPVCRQPDPRPNLAVRSIRVERSSPPYQRRYVVTVRNAGRSEAEDSTLTLSVDGIPLAPEPVPALDAGEDALVTLRGPACWPGTLLIAEVDSDEAIDERDEDDNSFSRLCPAPTL